MEKIRVKLGTLFAADIFGVLFEKLNNTAYLEDLFLRAAEIAQVTVLGKMSQQFTPQGVTAMLLLSESHLTIHTWPEHQSACIDFFTCGPAENAKKGIDFIISELAPDDFNLIEKSRGS